jgi:hypothetical protein
MRCAAVVVFAGCGFAPTAATLGDGGGSGGERDAARVVDSTSQLDGTASTADYDGDGIPDELDHCPHIKNALDPDTDHDGVGDDCDPRPGLRDARVYWSSFDDPLEINGWTGVGAWSVQSGEAVQGSTNNTVSYLQVPILVNRAYVATRLVSGTLNGSGTPGVGIQIRTTSGHVYGCAFQRTMGTVSTAATTNVTQKMLAAWPTNQIAGKAYSVTEDLSVPTNQNGCAFADPASGTTSSVMTAYTTGEASPPAGHVELTTASATAAYEYLFIVDTAPP